MSSKLVTPGSELYGKKKGDKDLGLKAVWAGSAQYPHQMTSIGDMDRPVASGARRKAHNPKPTKDHTGKGFTGHHLESHQ